MKQPLARDSAVDCAVKARTQAINQLRAVLVCADPALRESLSGRGPATLIRACAELPDPEAGPATTAAVIHTLRLLAHRIGQLTTEARDLQQRMTRVISAHTPQLLDQLGVGPDNAAALLIAAGAARATRSTPRPPPAPCSAARPSGPRRPPTDRRRCCGCSS